ncbi:hypothetical protein [Selenomonas ruminantium]|uniref:alpha-amylase family glycosyl hydrolase n=1 Tax=Selenomonas ruminantium TaxID=971 RepID=UPI000479A922|nr:hypothetical protein [Selenomonas ruminantium]
MPNGRKACRQGKAGTPYIYQGEEIGSQEALEILAARSRDNGRTPMQWSTEKYAGFFAVTPWILPPDNYRQINAASERHEQDSIFSF